MHIRECLRIYFIVSQTLTMSSKDASSPPKDHTFFYTCYTTIIGKSGIKV